MQINYCNVIQSNAILDIDDIGNAAIEAYNDDGLLWIMIMSTTIGLTRLIEIGPINPGSDNLEDQYIMTFQRMPFDGRKIVSSLDKFLNRSRKGYKPITQAIEVDIEEAFKKCPSIIEYIKEGGI